MYKIVSGYQDIAGKKKDGLEIAYADLVNEVNRLESDGWKVVGSGPNKNITQSRHSIIELLRNLPIISIIINWFFPLIYTNLVSIILVKEE